MLEQTVFVTGFPGFIAGRLIERLAAEGARLLLLVQPSFVARAQQELARLANRSNFPAGSLRVIEGDITLENLGLSQSDLALVRAEATTVFHLAAIYDLAVKRDLALHINLEGTRNVNQFSRSLLHLRRYHYISTCYVAGKREGVIYENELEHDAGFRNYYEESKYLAEREVEALKAELPVTIHRPAVVCGDSVTGETAKYDGIYYLIKYLLQKPHFLSQFNIGNLNVSLNLVPIDFVIEAMIALANAEAAVGKTVQIADPAPLTTHELFNAIARTIYDHGSRVTIPASLVQFFLTLPTSPPITGLPRHAVPYFFLKQTYDTKQAREMLAPAGIACPPFSSYVRTIVDFTAAHPHNPAQSERV